MTFTVLYVVYRNTYSTWWCSRLIKDPPKVALQIGRRQGLSFSDQLHAAVRRPGMVTAGWWTYCTRQLESRNSPGRAKEKHSARVAAVPSTRGPQTTYISSSSISLFSESGRSVSEEWRGPVYSWLQEKKQGRKNKKRVHPGTSNVQRETAFASPRVMEILHSGRRS